MWSPLGIVLHVLSGNVFLVGIGSLVEGLITGNINIIKMSSSEKCFMPRLVQSFIDCDDDKVVSQSIALIDYSATDVSVISALKKKVDGIVVWGGEQAVRAYRDDLPARTRLVVFGPKLSIAVVTRGGLDSEGADKIAGQLANDIAIWDQNACTAPQMCYVETLANARLFVGKLADALAKVELELPAGTVDTHVAVEIQKMRGVFEVAEAQGEGMEFGSRENVNWTVVLDQGLAIEPSPLHRTIRIVPFEKRADILAKAGELRGYLQTVGLATNPGSRMEWFSELAGAGALRIVDIGTMAGGEIDDPHDGIYDLAQLGNFVVGHFGLGWGIHPADRVVIIVKSSMTA